MGEESDMQDMLENGPYAGAPEPTERAVLGKFTAMVGDRPKLADIVHDALEHYEPYGSFVQRMEREVLRKNSPDGRFSPLDENIAMDRAAKSLYNATLARRSGWEADGR